MAIIYARALAGHHHYAAISRSHIAILQKDAQFSLPSDIDAFRINDALFSHSLLAAAMPAKMQMHAKIRAASKINYYRDDAATIINIMKLLIDDIIF